VSCRGASTGRRARLSSRLTGASPFCSALPSEPETRGKRFGFEHAFMMTSDLSCQLLASAWRGVSFDSFSRFAVERCRLVLVYRRAACSGHILPGDVSWSFVHPLLTALLIPPELVFDSCGCLPSTCRLRASSTRLASCISVPSSTFPGRRLWHFHCLSGPSVRVPDALLTQLELSERCPRKPPGKGRRRQIWRCPRPQQQQGDWCPRQHP